MAHVLVAEDDAEMRRLVVEALPKAGPAVTEAKDGGALLEQLAETFARDPSLSPVDVIVSDVRMPACNGLELIERLADAGLRVRCVLMTAFSDEETRRRARTAGALFLDKPLSLEALRDAVEWLARRGAGPRADAASSASSAGRPVSSGLRPARVLGATRGATRFHRTPSREAALAPYLRHVGNVSGHCSAGL